MTEQERQDIFQQAERERIQGSARKAVELYERIVDEPSEIQAEAQHMLGVVSCSTEDYERSEKLLRELARQTTEPNTRGRILRDLGNTLRKQERYDEASDVLRESLELFERSGAPAAERAATIGFQARVLANEEEFDQALELARLATDLFSEGDNRQMELYHAIFLAQLLAQADQPEEARALAQQLLPSARKLGKPMHVERLEIIAAQADDPEAMATAISNQRETP